MSFDIIPGVHLVNVTRDSEEKINKQLLQNKLQTVPVIIRVMSYLIQAEIRKTKYLR